MQSRLIIISGRSGCGKSIALHALEDLGFYCVDNLPLDLLFNLVSRVNPKNPDIAISIDSRNIPKDINQLNYTIEQIKNLNIETNIIYLHANKQVILKRYSETRRKHPLTNENLTLKEAIEQESVLISPLASLSNMSIDTNQLSNHQLHTKIREIVDNKKNNHLQLQLLSFGFKYGVPTDTDFLFDVRCLPNPFWIPELKPLNGKDKAVIDYLSHQKSVNKMLEHIQDFLKTWIPEFIENNRSYLTVSIGCTGGKHRSVFLVEALFERLRPLLDNIHKRHRELNA